MFKTVVPATVWAKSPEPVVLELDAEALGPDASARIEEGLRDAMIASLREEGFRVVTGEGHPVVRARFAFQEREDRDYAVHIELVEAGGEPQPLVEWFICTICTERALLERALVEFDDAVLGLHEALTPPPEPEAPIRPIPEPETQARIGPLGEASIGVIVSGVLVIGTGVSLRLTQRVRLGTRPPIEVPDLHRPFSAIVIAVGTTTVGLGLSALISDLVARRRGKQLPVQPTLTWSPRALSLSVRFAI